jgi:hypothetical protein
MRKIVWKSEKRRLAVLRVMEDNPRMASDKQRGDVMTSISRFNLADPFIINTDNGIIGGHLRYQELVKKFGLEHTVDVRVPDRKLTEKEVRELSWMCLPGRVLRLSGASRWTGDVLRWSWIRYTWT